jgi:hypothetical protein
MKNTANAPLSQELIASALNGLGLKYSCDSDGDFSMRFSGEQFGGALSIWVVVEGENKDILRTFVTNYRKIPHSIGFSGKRIVSYGEGRSTLDLPLIHEVQSQDQP